MAPRYVNVWKHPPSPALQSFQAPLFSPPRRDELARFSKNRANSAFEPGMDHRVTGGLFDGCVEREGQVIGNPVTGDNVLRLAIHRSRNDPLQHSAAKMGLHLL